MAKYKSNFAKLSFYCCDERKQFQGGVYETTDKKEIEVLDGLTDAQRVDEPKADTKEVKAPSKSEETKQSTTKKSTANARKSSAK